MDKTEVSKRQDPQGGLNEPTYPYRRMARKRRGEGHKISMDKDAYAENSISYMLGGLPTA